MGLGLIELGLIELELVRLRPMKLRSAMVLMKLGLAMELGWAMEWGYLLVRRLSPRGSSLRNANLAPIVPELIRAVLRTDRSLRE